MLGLIVSLLIIGLIAGALARLVIPGRQDISIVMTIVFGRHRVLRRWVPGLPAPPQRRAGRLLPTRRHHRFVHRRGHRPTDLDPDRKAPLGAPVSPTVQGLMTARSRAAQGG